jgi:hypothetical protein
MDDDLKPFSGKITLDDDMMADFDTESPEAQEYLHKNNLSEESSPNLAKHLLRKQKLTQLEYQMKSRLQPNIRNPTRFKETEHEDEADIE